MAGILQTALSGASLGRTVNDSLDSRKKFTAWLYPFTAVQSYCSRAISSRLDSLIRHIPFYERFKDRAKNAVANNYTRIEKPLQIIEKTAKFLDKGAKKGISYDPSPYSQSLSFILNDVSVAASQLRTALTLEPKLLRIIDQIEAIAKETIVQSLKDQCEAKIAVRQDPPSAPPIASEPSTGWFSGLRNRATRIYNYASDTYSYCSSKVEGLADRLKAPLYREIPAKAELGLGAAVEKVRSQIQMRRTQIEKTAIPKATDVVLQKVCSVLTFTGVNWVMNKGVGWMTNWAAGAAIHAAMPNAQEEEVNQYQQTVATGIYYFYLISVLTSYTFQLSAWRQQRVRDEAAVQLLQQNLIDPALTLKDHDSVRSLLDSITAVFTVALSASEGILDINLQPAIDRFKDRCRTEITWA
jgi:hypothetical protein